MKPFNLQAAIDGKPIQTRAGMPAKFLSYEPSVTDGYPVAAALDGSITRMTKDGKYYAPSAYRANNCAYDLFMVSTTRTVWVNIYRSDIGAVISSPEYPSEELAKEGIDSSGGLGNAWKYVTTINYQVEG